LRSDACLCRRHAIVTGGGRRIGAAAIAHALAELGAELSLMSRDMNRLHDTAETIRTRFDSRVKAYQVDLTDLASVQRAFVVATGPLGRVHMACELSRKIARRGAHNVDAPESPGPSGGSGRSSGCSSMALLAGRFSDYRAGDRSRWKRSDVKGTAFQKNRFSLNRFK